MPSHKIPKLVNASVQVLHPKTELQHTQLGVCMAAMAAREPPLIIVAADREELRTI